jgi:hypothetical protein
MVILEHHFLTTSFDIISLFEGTDKISTFCKKLEKQASKDPGRYPFEKYIGDGFELLVELIVKMSECDNRVGLKDYKPVLKDDNGVDGYAINLKGEISAVQVKYRVNSQKLLTSSGDRLDSFLSEAMFNGVFPETEDKCKRHYIFTTAEGLHHYTLNEKFRKSIKVFGYKELRELLDGNTHLWQRSLETITQNLEASK